MQCPSDVGDVVCGIRNGATVVLVVEELVDEVVVDVAGGVRNVCMLQPRAGGMKLTGLVMGFSLVVVVTEFGTVDVVDGGICEPSTVVVVSLVGVVEVVGADVGGNALCDVVRARTVAEAVRKMSREVRRTRKGQTRRLAARRSALFT